MSSLYPPGPSTDTYYLNPEFVWEKTYQHFYDATTGFVYDIFVQAYVYNNQYYHWNDREQTYFEIADPYVYAYSDVFGNNPGNLNPELDPRTHHLPTCYVWNQAADCFHSRIHNIYFSVKAGYYFHDGKYWEYGLEQQRFVPVSGVPDLNFEICWRHINSSCTNPSCKLSHSPLRFPVSPNIEDAAESEDPKDSIDIKFAGHLREYLRIAIQNGVPTNQMVKQLDRLHQQKFMSEDPESLDAGKLKRTVSKVRLEFEIPAETSDFENEQTNMPVAVSGPYNCPLCGRKTRDYNVMLAHIHLHNLVAEYGYPALDNLSEEPAEIQQLFSDEIQYIVGPEHLAAIVNRVKNAPAYHRTSKLNQCRAKCFQLLKQAGHSYADNFSCKIVHPIRTAFPEAFGQYSKKHECPSENSMME